MWNGDLETTTNSESSSCNNLVVTGHFNSLYSCSETEGKEKLDKSVLVTS